MAVMRERRGATESGRHPKTRFYAMIRLGALLGGLMTAEGIY